MPVDREQVIHRLSTRADVRHGDRWQDVMDVALLLDDTPKKERRPLMTLIAENTRYKVRTQQQMAQMWDKCKHPENGEPSLPLRLDWSTALMLVQHGADYWVLQTANDETWTRQEARLWASDKSRVTEDKPLRFGAALLKAIGDLRKHTEPLSDSEQVQFRLAALEFAKGFGK